MNLPFLSSEFVFQTAKHQRKGRQNATRIRHTCGFNPLVNGGILHLPFFKYELIQSQKDQTQVLRLK